MKKVTIIVITHNGKHHLKEVHLFKRRFDDGVAMRQICRNNSKGKNTLKMGMEYLSSQLAYILKNEPVWLPHAFLYNFVSFTALYMGKKEEFFPVWMKKRMSKHGELWYSVNQKIKINTS